MGSAFDAWSVIEIVQEAKEEEKREIETERGKRGDLRGHNKYRVRTRSGATYAVSDNDGVCSGCLLSEQISE
jgi:hypothetical protein